MRTYLGNSLVLATPMLRHVFDDYLGQLKDVSVDGQAPGYLIEQPEGVSNHLNHAGSLRWLPELEFKCTFLDLGNLAGHSTAQQLMASEIALLNSRLQEHKRYCTSDRFLKIPFKARELLQEQIRLMSRYACVLQERLQLG